MDEKVLEKVELFQNLTPAEMRAVAAAGVEKRVEKGSFFFMQGDPAEALYVLGKGNVKLSQVTTDGQQVILRVAGPGEAFGIIAVLAQAEYPVTAEAVEDCTATAWRRSQLDGLIKKMPVLAINTVQMMAAQVKDYQNKLREMATERVERRIARTLLRLAKQTGRKTSEGVVIDMTLTRQDLAEMTGTTLYTVSRVLSQWETQGLVKSKRERVVIVFPHGLVTIAEDLPRRGSND